MNENQIERKLICILAADVAGYSRLMAADEEGTIRNLKSLQTEVLNPTAAKYNGEVVKLMGDGILMRFHSVVDAVGFGKAFQQLVLKFNSQFPEEKHIRFRIGINIGDVVVEEGDMFGDGVNIAARLETLSEPGGICVSGTVVDHVKGKLDVEFFDCGEQQVKNIPGKIRIFKSVKDGLTDSSSGESGTDRQA